MTEAKDPSHNDEFPSYPGPRTLPVLFDIDGQRCLVVGGGSAGRRKAAALLSAGALVTMVDPEPVQLSGVNHDQRSWRPGDSADCVITVIATNDPAINEAAAIDAKFHHSLVLRSDRPELGQLRLPAVHRQDDVTVAVDTTGASPTLAAYLRDEIAKDTAHWGTLADWARIHRPVTAAQIAEHEARLRTENLE